jgi:ankyrin repeat protein
MSAPEAPRRPLPASPSIEHLRKQAKRLAKDEKLKLSVAQHRLAQSYGFRNWAMLAKAVDTRRSPLALAAAMADDAAVAALIAEGAAVDGAAADDATPLFLVCDSDRPAHKRLAVASRLLDAGAFVRGGGPRGMTPLHAAARRGPAALVELLLRHGALFWQGDDKGLRPHDYAREGAPADRERILYLTADGPKIEDAGFRAAVAAIQAGDAAALTALLDARPSLLSERAIEPDLGPKGYFSDPMLFWFVANNPTLVPQSPPNIVEVAKLMIARGVAQRDLDYALELTMTNGMMAPAQQIALTEALVEAGAVASHQAILMTLGHEQREAVAWLVARGRALDAVTAAGLGRVDALPGLLQAASADEKAEALAMAVINHQVKAVRCCLGAGADATRFMPVHAHSTPLHNAALHGDLEIMKLLVAAGARADVTDTLWRGTPIDWAVHGQQVAAEAYLRGLRSLG